MRKCFNILFTRFLKLIREKKLFDRFITLTKILILIIRKK